MGRQVGFGVRLGVGTDVADAELGIRQNGKVTMPAGRIEVTAFGARQKGAGLQFHFGPR